MKAGIVVLGHGSRASVGEANKVTFQITDLVKEKAGSDLVETAIMNRQSGLQSLGEATKRLLGRGATQIIVVPMFLANGMHIQADIPEEIEGLRQMYPQVPITMAAHIGPDPRIADILLERVREVQFITDPETIEHRSMELIAPYLAGLNLDEAATKVYSRIIHAAGDPDYANHIKIHPQAIAVGCKALRQGRPVFCDVEMVRTGINKRRLAEYGGQVHCLIGDEEVARQAKSSGITRAMAAMRTFGQDLDGAVVAIGNAPTALFEILRLMAETPVRPALIVGVPVGFVGASESKELLASSSPVPYITIQGNKGGSPIAAATLNALLYMPEPI